VACSPRYSDFFPYDNEGVAKPCVALLPVRTGGCSTPERLGQIDQALLSRLMEGGMVFVPAADSIQRSLEVAGPCNYFSRDLSFCRYYQGYDYLVVIELIHDGVIPAGSVGGEYWCYDPCPLSCDLYGIQARVKAISLKGDCPRVILQEVTQVQRVVCAQSLNPEDVRKVTDKLVRDIGKRLELLF